MQKIILLFTLLIFTAGCRNDSNNKQAIEVDFIQYNKNTNQAIVFKEKADTSNCLLKLKEALKLIKQQNEIPVPYWLIGAILKFSTKISENEVKEILEKNPIALTDPNRFYAKLNDPIKSWAMKYTILENPDKYYHPDHKKISARIDTLIAIDQALLGHDIGEEEKFLTTEYWHLVNNPKEGTAYLFEQMLKLHKDFNNIGKHSCKNCNRLLALYIHIEDDVFIEKIKPAFLNLVKSGYMASNEFAIIYDRAYSKLGEFKKEYFYYFNFYKPRVSKGFKLMEDLNENEIILVNERREIIGIPPIPYKFHNLMDVIK